MPKPKEILCLTFLVDLMKQSSVKELREFRKMVESAISEKEIEVLLQMKDQLDIMKLQLNIFDKVEKL